MLGPRQKKVGGGWNFREVSYDKFLKNNLSKTEVAGVC